MTLKTNYKAARAAGMTAAAAIAAARDDVAHGRNRYTPSDGAGLEGTFAAYGCAGLRWVENPAAIGLRRVGLAHELARLGHTGWYTDDDGAGSLVRGVVYQLPARGRRSLYVAGWADPENDGAACLDFADVRYGETGGHGDGRWSDGADQSTRREMAREAARIAERVAEAEREHAQAWNSGQRWAQLGDDLATLRREFRTMRGELRALRIAGALTTTATLCETIAARLRRIVCEVGNLKSERATLADTYNGRWCNADHVAAFNDGAGRVVVGAGS